MVTLRSTLASIFLATVAYVAPAQATFVMSTATDWQTPATSLNIDVQNTGTTAYSGKVGTEVINITTTTPTDTGSGNAIITPTGNGPNQDIFSSATFTPVDHIFT